MSAFASFDNNSINSNQTVKPLDLFYQGCLSLLAVNKDNFWTKLTRYFWLVWTGAGGTVQHTRLSVGIPCLRPRIIRTTDECQWEINSSMALPECKIHRMTRGLCMKGGVRIPVSLTLNIRASNWELYVNVSLNTHWPGLSHMHTHTHAYSFVPVPWSLLTHNHRSK